MLDMAERKATKTLVSVRVNTNTLHRLDGLANARGRTRSELIDRAIEEFVNRETPAAPPPIRPPGKRG